MTTHSLSFKSQMQKFVEKTNKNFASVSKASARGALNSIKYGSDLTGAPGQPVGETGHLLESWVMEDLGGARWLIYSDSPYARQNEDGIARPGGGSYIQRSAVGGRWSVHKTKTGFQRIVDDVVTKLERGRTR